MKHVQSATLLHPNQIPGAAEDYPENV